jgi:hypothetical protein
MDQRNDPNPLDDIRDAPRDALRFWTDNDAERKADDDSNNDRYDPPPEEDKSGFCFITSACVAHAGLDDDCHELTVLRRFRDDYIARLPTGAALLAEYYRAAPRIVHAINASSDKQAILASTFAHIRTAVSHIEAGSPSMALSIYSDLFSDLKTRFGTT